MFFRIISLAACFILIGCGSGERVFDYGNKDVTEGLTVDPSSSISFASKDETQFFSLHFSEKDLFLLDIDNTSLSVDFKMDIPIFPNDCRENISTSEQGCRIYIRYDPTGAGAHSGKIILYFEYVQDPERGKTKEHVLNVLGNS